MGLHEGGLKLDCLMCCDALAVDVKKENETGSNGDFLLKLPTGLSNASKRSIVSFGMTSFY